jgi:energy-coupling factor transport system permease protein
MAFLYQPGDSFLHRMDSISKSLWLLAVGLLVLFSGDWYVNAIVFIAVLVTGFVLGGVSPVLLLRRLLPLYLLAIWLLVLFSVIYPGGVTPLIHLGPITATREGLFYGLAIALRVLSLGSSSVFFAATTDPRRMVNEYIEVAHVPYRAAFALYAALRFLPMIQYEATNVRNARAIRAQGRVAVGLRDRLALFRSLTVALLVNVIRRVQVTAIAMDSRAFGAYGSRTGIDDVVRPWAGILFALAWLTVVVLYLVFVVVLGGHGPIAAPVIPGQ